MHGPLVRTLPSSPQLVFLADGSLLAKAVSAWFVAAHLSRCERVPRPLCVGGRLVAVIWEDSKRSDNSCFLSALDPAKGTRQFRAIRPSSPESPAGSFLPQCFLLHSLTYCWVTDYPETW